MSIQDFVRSKECVAAVDIKRLAQEAGLPEATVRGVISYYTDLQSRKGALRICQGTSCKLSGAERLKSLLQARSECRDV